MTRCLKTAVLAVALAGSLAAGAIACPDHEDTSIRDAIRQGQVLSPGGVWDGR